MVAVSIDWTGQVLLTVGLVHRVPSHRARAEQHPVLQHFLVQQVNVTGLRHDVSWVGELRRGWVDPKEILDLARTQVGDRARAIDGPEADLAVVLRELQIE